MCLLEMSDSWTVTVEEDPKTGELILPIPDDLLVQMGWAEGDELVWEERINLCTISSLYGLLLKSVLNI